MRLGTRFAAASLCVLSCVVAVSCRGGGDSLGGGASGGAMTERRPIEAVLADHTPRLMAIEGVVGTYQGALDDGTDSVGAALDDGDGAAGGVALAVLLRVCVELPAVGAE